MAVVRTWTFEKVGTPQQNIEGHRAVAAACPGHYFEASHRHPPARASASPRSVQRKSRMLTGGLVRRTVIPASACAGTGERPAGPPEAGRDGLQRTPSATSASARPPERDQRGQTVSLLEDRKRRALRLAAM